MEVTPHLKSVLKTYQHSATKSLQGPGFASLGTPKSDHSSSSPEIKEEEFVPAQFPVQQVPILTTPDTSCSECSETVLEGESISCFVVGGEKRLCLPQVLKSVLRDFTLAQINQECDQLQIYCSRCTPEQLNVLKNQGILPSVAPSCGLITKTDAERLCSALLYGQVNTGLRPRKDALSIPIYHECFGRARGVCFPELYVEKNAKCVECSDCQSGFSPQQFVCHVHRDLENRTVHWGFDSCNWRSYLHVSLDNPDRERFLSILDEMKEQYEGNADFPQPIVEPIVKRKQVTAADILKDHELPLKKQKLNDFLMMPYNLQQPTCIQQLYASLDPRYILQEYMPVNRHLSAFKPVAQSIKESKMRSAAALGRYPPADPPLLQHPERVVRVSESERFETSYQPNVALAPPTPKKHRYGRCNSVKTEPTSPVKVEEAQSTGTPKEDGENVIESSTVSVVQSTATVPKYNPEIELSTDTEDSASETSEKQLDLGKVEDILKDTAVTSRDKILEFIRNLAKENARLLAENCSKDNKISELELRNSELIEELKELTSAKKIVENGHHHPECDIEDVSTTTVKQKEEKIVCEAQKTVIAIVAEQKDAIIKTAPE